MWTTFLLSFNFVMKKVKQYLLARFVLFLNYNNVSNKKWLTYDVASMIVESSWNVSCPSVLNRQQFLRVLHVMSSNQGCCLTGARSPEAPKFRVRATKVLFKEPDWAPKHGVLIPI